MQKILIISFNFPPTIGGIETYARELKQYFNITRIIIKNTQLKQIKITHKYIYLSSLLCSVCAHVDVRHAVRLRHTSDPTL